MTNNDLKTVSCPTEISVNSIKIGIAITPTEKREIYRFRYQTYVEEMSKHIKDIDYANKLLYDEMDEWAFLLYAKFGSELIGTARINIGNLADFPREVAGFLSLDTFQDCYTGHSNQFSFITKIMVTPTHRSSPVFYLLMAKCYELCCRNQIQFVFGICNYHLIRLYEKMGLHRYYRNFDLPGYGLQVPIVLLVNDIQHLRRVRSPLFRIARKRGTVNTQSIEWFHAIFTKHSHIINSQIVKEEELWSILCNRLACQPTEAITILQELSVTEAKKFLHVCSSFVPCDSGNIITNQGDVSYSYNILISGKLKSLTFHRPTKEYTFPGQPFGANGLTELNKHTEDIAATNSAEILVLSGFSFQKFYHSSPEIAHKIVQTIIKLRSIKLI
jgi:hypothetical protein